MKKLSPLAAFLLLASVGVAQAQVAPGGERIVLTQTVEPSFRIEPVVHRFSARRGEVLPFQFAIGSLGRDMEVTIQPVNLRQESSGIILHDQQSEPANALSLKSGNTMQIGPGEMKVIEGQVTVPIAKSNYLSYGILVREAGVDPNFDEAGDGPTKAGIRFVTQYVLRIDVETGVAGVGAMKEMRFEEADLVANKGLPEAHTYLVNPTPYAHECFVTAELLDQGVSRPRPVRLGMPSRKNLDGDDRYLVRIMPNSRLLLEAPYNEPVLVGEQTMQVSLSGGRSNAVAADFPVDIRAEDFPALAVRRKELAEGLTVSPAQVELGVTRETKRTHGLKFMNKSAEPVQVELTAEDLPGNALDSVRISPSSFELKPGRTKGVRAMLLSGKASSTCGRIRVAVRGDQLLSTEHTLPLSILHEAPSTPDIYLSSIDWLPQDGGAFAVRLQNNSKHYMPINATLAVAGENGVSISLEGGYGEWLEPQGELELTFRPKEQLVGREYLLKLLIHTRDEFEPIVRELKVDLGKPETSGQST